MIALSLADEPLFGLPLTDLWFVLIFFTLAMFLTLDGWDFGVGALFGTAAADGHRDAMLAAVGPFWDGNEVWLIVFGGGLFAVFPAVYANLFSRHYLLMFAILGALILRGAASEFYEERHDARWQRFWGRTFVVGSTAAPFLLGMFTANWLIGAERTLTLPAFVVGLAVVALTIVAAVPYLGRKLPEFPAAFSRYGIAADAAYLALVVVTVGYIYLAVPDLRSAVVSTPTLVLVVLTVALVGAYLLALRRDRHLAALLVAGGQTFALVALVAFLLYPTIDPATGLTVQEAVVGTLQMNLMTIVAAIFVPLVLVYFAALYWVFRGPVEAGEGY